MLSKHETNLLMKPAALFCLAISILLISCKKEERISGGSYSGYSLQVAPFFGPLGTSTTNLTVTFGNGRFSGSSDTAQIVGAMIVGSGTFQIHSDKISFVQDTLTYLTISPNNRLLAGEYDLKKTGDSLVFQILPPRGSLGGSSTWFRLRMN